MNRNTLQNPGKPQGGEGEAPEEVYARLAKVYSLAIRRYREHNEEKEKRGTDAKNTDTAIQTPDTEATG